MGLEIHPYSTVKKQLDETQGQLDQLTAAIAAEESKSPRNMPWLAKVKDKHHELTGAVGALQWVLSLA